MRDYSEQEVRSEVADLMREREQRTNGKYHAEAPKQDFGTVCAFDLEGKEVPERQWLVDGVIPHENVTLLSGDGGLGKTILALMLGTSLSTKRDWLGFQAMQGPFLYVGAEDDEDEIHRRLDQIRFELGLGWGDFCDFHYKSLVGEDAILATYDRATQTMRATSKLDALERKLGDLGAIACVIDTAADVFGGEEINRGQVRQFIGLLRGICKRQHVSIILLSHPSVAGMNTGSGISGSTAWNNSVRSRLYLEQVDSDNDARTLKFMKSNYGPKGKPLALRYQRGLFVPDAVTAAKTPAEADAMFLTMLDKYTEQGRHVSPNKSSGYAPTVFASDKSCGVKHAELKDAMDRLLASKEIRAEQYGPPSRVRTKLVRRDA
jgi:RecA-family ATPase